MASGDDEVRVVRCTHSELKKLAMDLEMRRSDSRDNVRKDSSRSAMKCRQDLGDKQRRKRSDSDVMKGTQDCENMNKVNRNATAKKPSKGSHKKVVEKEPSLEKTDVNNDSEKRKNLTKKKIDLSGSGGLGSTGFQRDSKIAVINSKNSLDNDYDRGERPHSGSPKSLYDPMTDSIPPTSPVKRESMRKKYDNQVNVTKDKTSQNLTEKVNDLHVWSDERNIITSSKSGDNNLLLANRTPSQKKGKQPNSKKTERKKAESLFAEVTYLEMDLDNLLSRRLSSQDQLNHITQLSREVREKCKFIMLTDLQFFTTKEVYHILWKSGFYQVIERLRGLLKDTQDGDGVDFTTKIPGILQEYLDLAGIFISDMRASLEDEHDFLMKSFLEKPTTFDSCNRLVKMALLCCHHLMIFCGDVERYKQHLSPVKEWSTARSCYLKASKIAPRNGKPYNQLAVIAVYAKRRLDAVYYYVRSLTVSKPIMTAREKLHAIYDDVQRKAYELLVGAQEMKGTSPHNNRKAVNGIENGQWSKMGYGSPQSRQKYESKESSGSLTEKKTDGRHELWVFYRAGVRQEFLFTPGGLLKGGVTKQESNVDENKPASSKISLNEINKQFEVFFLCCHGMLYSKIGIDHLSDNHRRMLGLFKTLLRHPTCPAVGMKRLVEIMAINMFEVANMATEDFGQLVEGTPLDLAINLASDMFQCLSKTVSEMLLQRLNSEEGDTSGDDLYRIMLAKYLSAIKVWFDWMQTNVTLLRSSSVSMNEDFWDGVSVLLNGLTHLYSKDDLAGVKPGDFTVTLSEDDHLNGFNLLAQATKPRINIKSVSDKELACLKLRIESIQVVAKFLCEFEDLPLKFDREFNNYYAIRITAATLGADRNEDGEHTDEISEEDIEDDVVVESVEDFDSDTEMADSMKELKARKTALTKEILNQKQREEDAKAILVEHSSKPTLVLEINPQYLVPDTNCFIYHLPDLQFIAESKDFTIVVPLVVINELDGLSKGTCNAELSQQQHAAYVAERSRAAIAFLEYRFSAGDSQMLAVTSKGSVLTTIAFRSEEPMSRKGINDDVILKCCIHFCDAKMDVVNKLASADQPFTIRRKVVLLTEDRNLRLKAHVQNVPVITVPQFLGMLAP